MAKYNAEFKKEVVDFVNGNPEIHPMDVCNKFQISDRTLNYFIKAAEGKIKKHPPKKAPAPSDSEWAQHYKTKITALEGEVSKWKDAFARSMLQHMNHGSS